MKISYIGRGGVLNTMLHDSLQKLGHDVDVLSARETNLLVSGSSVVFGGRNVGKSILGLIKDADRFVYLSTMIYNGYLDAYQSTKHENSIDVIDSGGKVIYIPFVEELTPLVVSRIITEEVTGFYIYSTSVDYIAKNIISYVKGNDEPLLFHKVNVKSNLVNGLLWRYFGRMYSLVGKISNKEFKLKVLIVVKIMEKLAHKVTFSSGLSTVFVKYKR
ncbi:TPA: hypothetical protein ACYHOF_002359 [Vibrio cholerae]|nr:hypothetical protein [Vibrio cholerae]